MKSECFLAVAALLTMILPDGLAGEPRRESGGTIHGSFTWQKRQRRYLMHLPAGPNRPENPALVIVLHGGGGTPERIAELTGFSALADQEGFIAVYPEAVNRHWNDGRNVFEYRAHREEVDDVGFIAELIDRLVIRQGVNPKRVYVTGMSNGAIMCHRLALEIPRRIAAIAPVCGALPENLTEQDAEATPEPMPVLALNGTDDPFVPWDGGGVGLFAKRGMVISVPATTNFWRKRNRCNRETQTQVVQARADDLTAVDRTEWFGDNPRSHVVLYRIVRGGHTWPLGRQRPRQFGRRNTSLPATLVIWEFFQRHSR